MPLKLVGKHGGSKKSDKLSASNHRTSILTKKIEKFSPDLTISFCSPEASRVAFGLGIKHIVFSDSPHANAVMKISLPLVQKLMTPWIIPKKEFLKFGINEKNIIHYKAIDASIIAKRKIINDNKKKSTGKKISNYSTEQGLISLYLFSYSGPNIWINFTIYVFNYIFW